MTEEERAFRHREFWLWEFARRNEEYRRDYDAFVQKWEQFTPIKNYQRENILAILLAVKGAADLELVTGVKRERAFAFVEDMNRELGIFSDKYGRTPKDFTLGYSADAMINALLANNESIFDEYVDFERRAVATTHVELGDGKVMVVMDTNRDLEQMTREIRFIYYDCKYQDPEKKPNREVERAWDDCVRQEIKASGSRVRSANLPRACGLWVYEYLAAHQDITENAAIEKFSQGPGANIEAQLEMKTALDNRRVKKLLDTVRSSIEQITYLSFS